jgi:hypothetical protein
VQAHSLLDNPDAAFLTLRGYARTLRALQTASTCRLRVAVGLASRHPLVDTHQRGALTVTTWPPPKRKNNPTRPTFVLLGLLVGRVPNSALQGARGDQPERSNNTRVLAPPLAAHLRGVRWGSCDEPGRLRDSFRPLLEAEGLWSTPGLVKEEDKSLLRGGQKER